MSTPTAPRANSTNKKELKSLIEQQLETALAGWKNELGEKKFRKKIRKTAKLFGKDLKHAPLAAAMVVKKKAGKKTSPKRP